MKYRAWFSIIGKPTKMAATLGVCGIRMSATIAIEADNMAAALVKIAGVLKKDNADVEVIKIRVHPKSQLGDM